MFRRMFRYLSALTMLVLYVAAVLGGDVAALTCECRNHHHADVHTSLHHVHKCSSQSCTHHVQECGEEVVCEACSCHHDHSTEVTLYTYPRLDEGSARQTILLAVFANAELKLEPAVKFISYDYSEYCLPAPKEGCVGNYALRAPPQLV